MLVLHMNWCVLGDDSAGWMSETAWGLLKSAWLEGFSLRSTLSLSGWMSSRSIKIYILRVKKKQERSNDNISYSPKFKTLVYTKIFYLHLFFELASSNLMIICFVLWWDIFSKHWFKGCFYEIFGNDDVQPFMSHSDDHLCRSQCLFLQTIFSGRTSLCKVHRIDKDQSKHNLCFQRLDPKITYGG